jgi:hypothetical protein
MKVEAELKKLYKITVGDDGCCMGQYYSEDDWKEPHYGENLKDIVENLSIQYYKRLPKTFELEQVEVLIYNGVKYDYRIIAEYNSFSKEHVLENEYNEFWKHWRELEPERKRICEIQEAKEKRKEKLKQIQAEEEKKKKKLEEYLKLKKEFEK